MAGFWSWFRRENLWEKVGMFILLAIAWSIIYITLFVPFGNKYVLAHPEFSIINSFLINLIFIAISLFLIGVAIDGIKLALKFSFSLLSSFVGISLMNAPLCISPATGNIMVTEANATCKASADAAVSYLLNHWFHIAYSPAMYYWTYLTFGTILFVSGGIMIVITLRQAGIKVDEK